MNYRFPRKIAFNDALVYDGDQKQKAGLYFSECEGLKLCRSASNVPTSRSAEYHQLGPETGDDMDWIEYFIT